MQLDGSWNFGDGTTSTDQSPSHTYSSAGTYTVNLVVSNANGTSLASNTININSGESSSSSSSSSGGSGGGGAGGSPEPAKNVQVKELSQAFITNGKPVMFDFPHNATCVVYLSFDSKKTAGKTTTIAEQLKNKSTIVSELNSGEVYKYFNVWVGTGGFETSKNIENPILCFKVEKAWIKDKNIDKSSINLNRYDEKKWSQLSVKLLNEDSKYLYFTAETPEFSFFAITGTSKPPKETGTGIQLASNETINENDTENKEPQNQQNEILKTQGFEVYYGVIGLLAVFLYKIK
jgi:chitinase